MRLSGNGNAKQFFKKHGVTEVQMQSETKYSTRAADEYKRYLRKLLSESEPQAASPAKASAAQGGGRDKAWESSSGLDNLLKSVSGGDLSGLEKEEEEEEGPVTVFKAMTVAAPAPAPAPAPKPVEKKEPVVIGTLSTKLEDAGPAPKPVLMKVSSLGAKKGSSKPKLVARKLVGGSSGIGMESFEDVDKRSEAAKQEEQDHALAVKLHNQDAGSAGGSSRLAAIYNDAESIYKPAQQQKPSGSLYGAAAQAHSPRSMGGSSGSAVPKSVPAGNGYAQSKFTSQKGISSDQYFDRGGGGGGAEGEAAARDRLGNFKNSSAISSDMLSGNGRERASSFEDFMPDELSMREIKRSVKGFFDSVQNM